MKWIKLFLVFAVFYMFLMWGIEASWWIVLMPVWAVLACALAILIITVILVFIEIKSEEHEDYWEY